MAGRQLMLLVMRGSRVRHSAMCSPAKAGAVAAKRHIATAPASAGEHAVCVLAPPPLKKLLGKAKQFFRFARQPVLAGGIFIRFIPGRIGRNRLPNLSKPHIMPHRQCELRDHLAGMAGHDSHAQNRILSLPGGVSTFTNPAVSLSAIARSRSSSS